MKKRETICWNCKRASGNPQHPCSWATKFKPVEGWKAIPNKTYKITNSLTKKEEYTQSYTVIECPLYSQFSLFLDYSEAVKTISDQCKCTPTTFYRNPLKWIKKYEEIAQVTVPEWVKYRAKFGDV